MDPIAIYFEYVRFFAKCLLVIVVFVLNAIFIELECFSQNNVILQQDLYPVPIIYEEVLQRPLLDTLILDVPGAPEGKFPTFDGDPFALVYDIEFFTIADSQDAIVFKNSLLSELQLNSDNSQVRYQTNIRANSFPAYGIDSVLSNSANGDFILDRRNNSIVEDSLIKNTIELNFLLENQVLDGAASEIYLFKQVVNDSVEIVNADFRIEYAPSISSILVSGLVFRDVEFLNSNDIIISSDSAHTIGLTHISQYTNVSLTRVLPSKFVALPYGNGFLYCWEIVVEAVEGQYRLWINTNDGQVVALYPEYSYADLPASGQGYSPDPTGTLSDFLFRVDAIPPGGPYELILTDTLAISEDNCTSQVVGLDIGGVADFSSFPYPSCEFTTINTYAWIYRLISNSKFMWHNLDPFGQINVAVNKSGSIASSTHSNEINLSIGTGLSSSCYDCETGSPPYQNAGLDATVIAHEFGHLINFYQDDRGGNFNNSVDEGLADFWSFLGTGISQVGGYWSNRSSSCSTCNSGKVPRRVDIDDVFPIYSPVWNNHEEGQYLAKALWDTHKEMIEYSLASSLELKLRLFNAIIHFNKYSGSRTDKKTFNAINDVQIQLVSRYKTDWKAHKILASFSRAGIHILNDKPLALIDARRDYWNSFSSPLFTIWTGSHYKFDGNVAGNLDPSEELPFNTHFEVQLSNDENFGDPNDLTFCGRLKQTDNNGVVSWRIPFFTWRYRMFSWDRAYYRVLTYSKDANLDGKITIADDLGATNCKLMGIETAPMVKVKNSIHVNGSSLNYTLRAPNIFLTRRWFSAEIILVGSVLITWVTARRFLSS